MFLAHFVGKNQLPDLSVSGTLVGNGLNISFMPFIHNFEKWSNILLKTLQYEHRKIKERIKRVIKERVNIKVSV